MRKYYEEGFDQRIVSIGMTLEEMSLKKKDCLIVWFGSRKGAFPGMC